MLSVDEIDRCDRGIFEEFQTFYYGEWPRQRRVGVRAAWLAYKRLRKHYSVAEILSGLRRWVAYWEKRRTEAHYIPHPTTWLNEGRFLDAPPLPARAPAPPDINQIMGLS